MLNFYIFPGGFLSFFISFFLSIFLSFFLSFYLSFFLSYFIYSLFFLLIVSVFPRGVRRPCFSTHLSVPSQSDYSNSKNGKSKKKKNLIQQHKEVYLKKNAVHYFSIFRYIFVPSLS